MRGWDKIIAALIILLPGMVEVAMAGWQDWWWRSDQQGAVALMQGQTAKAAEKFQDVAWKGVAYYRAGDYSKSLVSFSKNKTTAALYNRGNALAHLGRYSEAIQAYTAVLQQDPKDLDAEHNKLVLEHLLKQQQQARTDQEQTAKEEVSSSTENQTGSQGKERDQDKKNQDSSTTAQESAQEKQTQKNQTAQKKSPSSASEEQSKANMASKKTSVAPQSKQPIQQQTVPTMAEQQAAQQWLQQIPDEPGGLLRQKFLRDHERYQTVEGEPES